MVYLVTKHDGLLRRCRGCQLTRTMWIGVQLDGTVIVACCVCQRVYQRVDPPVVTDAVSKTVLNQ